MATTTPLTDAINALTAYSNTVTGASDTDLSSAVATLAAGYGGGGDTVSSQLDQICSEWSSGIFTPSDDIALGSAYAIADHGLSAAPDFIFALSAVAVTTTSAKIYFLAGNNQIHYYLTNANDNYSANFVNTTSNGIKINQGATQLTSDSTSIYISSSSSQHYLAGGVPIWWFAGISNQIDT